MQAEIMLVESWPADATDPEQVWLAELDRFDTVRIEGAIARQEDDCRTFDLDARSEFFRAAEG